MVTLKLVSVQSGADLYERREGVGQATRVERGDGEQHVTMTPAEIAAELATTADRLETAVNAVYAEKGEAVIAWTRLWLGERGLTGTVERMAAGAPFQNPIGPDNLRRIADAAGLTDVAVYRTERN